MELNSSNYYDGKRNKVSRDIGTIRCLENVSAPSKN